MMIRQVFVIALLVSGCAVTTTSLQNAYVEGPARKSTIRVSEDSGVNTVIFRPYLTYCTQTAINLNTGTHSKVDSAGVYTLIPVENHEYLIEPEGVNIYSYKGKNLTWALPQMKLGFDLEFFYESFGLILGLDYASVDNRRFWGGNLGVAFAHRYSLWAWRMDFNVHFNHIYYQVDYLNKTDLILPWDSDMYVIPLSTEGEDLNWNPEFSLTLNSNNIEWPVNVFTSLSFGSQTLFDLPELVPQIGDLSYTDSYSYISAGLFSKISPVHRLLIGIRWNYHTDINSDIRYLDYILQLDIFLTKEAKE
jgi:hypothetical protein